MKTKTEHSPLPWKFEKNNGKHTARIMDESGKRLILDFGVVLYDDAAFIVRAVNSREALLAELKNARRILAKHNYAVGSLDLLIAQADGGK